MCSVRKLVKDDTVRNGIICICICKYMVKKKPYPDGSSILFAASFRKECRAIIPKKLLRASLGLSPRRTDLIQQVTTLDCNLYWEASAVFPIWNFESSHWSA